MPTIHHPRKTPGLTRDISPASTPSILQCVATPHCVPSSDRRLCFPYALWYQEVAKAVANGGEVGLGRTNFKLPEPFAGDTGETKG